ncbi:hypothetical protein GF357_03280 [Candidatus Dojkabacteria bacterium]|nr:hypothetical protein [Candidatus Dojkabacteria bacterium]
MKSHKSKIIWFAAVAITLQLICTGDVYAEAGLSEAIRTETYKINEKVAINAYPTEKGEVVMIAYHFMNSLRPIASRKH